MKVFISGKISGIEEQAFQIFETAEINLRAAGYEPINPEPRPRQKLGQLYEGLYYSPLSM